MRVSPTCLKAFGQSYLSLLSTKDQRLKTFSGGILMWNTRHDIIYDRNCILADCLAYHSLGYFIFDTSSLIRLFYLKLKTTRLSKLIWYRPDLSFHHFGVIFIFTPIVLCFRRGLGDFFVGMAFLMELSTPFLALKGLLQVLDLRSEFSRVFLLNSIGLTLTFLAARLFPLPYAYWLYAKQRPRYRPTELAISYGGSRIEVLFFVVGVAVYTRSSMGSFLFGSNYNTKHRDKLKTVCCGHQSLWEACSGLAWHCNLGSVALFAFQGYWFISMVRSTTRLFCEEVALRVPPSSSATTTRKSLGEPCEKRK